MVQFHGTATDPLAAAAGADLVVASGGPRGLRTIRRSFMGARMIWTSVVDDTIWGPTLGAADDFNQVMTGPITLGSTLTMMRSCNIVGARLYKSPTAAGSVPVGMWGPTGALLASKTLTWVSDEGGWREVVWDAPVPVVSGQEYHWGYFYPNADTNYATAIWVWNGQDYTNYPFYQKGYSVTGTGARSRGMWRFAGGTGLTFSSASTDRVAADYYIDPIAEWTDDESGYDGGTAYWSQWSNGAWFQENIPIAMFWANLEDYAAYVDSGINLMATGDSATQSNVDQFKAQEAAHPGSLKWMPSLYSDDMSGPRAANDDPVVGDIIVGYFVMDEPEFNQNPWYDPDTTLSWKNDARRIDATRPMWQNLSKMTADNQGFVFAPAGVDMVTKELNIRRYGRQTDWASLDKYSLAASESYAMNTAPGRPNRFGLWTYPLCVKRIREVTDGRNPVISVVESTSEFPGLPTPTQVDRAVWSTLIAGARGVEYFDHRFPDADVSQDFGAYLRNAPMKAQITATNARIQSLKAAVFAPEAGLVEGYTSTGAMAFAQGGYAIGARVPVHFTSRVAGGVTYIFAQSIRDGATNATFYVPALAGATLTVIGESRTVSVDGTGHFTDSFADYSYHLYSTATAPAYVAPTGGAPPQIGTDGAPQPGDTITCSKGAWTGSCLTASEYWWPQLAYQWQRDGADVAGEARDTYLVRSGDVGHAIRCVVTATNPAGSASATSAAVTILAPDAPPVNNTPPALTTDGTPQVGDTVSCSQGSWTSVLAVGYSYQWQRDAANIVGATGSTYALALADDGHSVRCVVTATNAAGSTSVNSDAVTVSPASAPTNIVAPAVTPTGSPVTGTLLTCSAGTWTGSPSFAFKWQRDPGSGFVDVAGATTSTHTTVSADEGATVRCVVTATNGGGSTSANSNTVTPAAPSTAYRDAVMADSPLGYWRLADLTDSSGGGRDLTVVGGVHAPTFVAGLVPSSTDNAAQFDGFGQLSRATDSGLAAVTAGITLEGWYKYTSPPYPTAVAGLGKNVLYTRSNLIGFQVAVGGAGAVLHLDFLMTVTQGVAYHLAATYDLADLKIYLNGANVATYHEEHATIDSQTDPLTISGGVEGTGGFTTFTGVLDEVVLYDHALSAARIAAHYAAAGA